MITSIDKAIVALLGSVLSIVAAFGVDVTWASDGLIASVGAVLTAVLVWLVPNNE